MARFRLIEFAHPESNTSMILHMKTSRLLTIAGLLVSAASADALSTLDLTTAGASGTINGGFFQQVPNQSTGTGVIEPFVRLQATGQEFPESGFNTDLAPMPTVKTGIWTHDILLSAIPVVNRGGIDYYQILLDINQNSGGSNELLSLNELEIYTRTGALTSADEYSDLTGGATLVWDLDETEDWTIELNYSLNPGSGSGDMFAYIPVSDVGTDGTKNFYLFSSFGVPNGPNDGFEEWAVVRAPTTQVPDGGGTVALLGLALAGIASARRFMKKA
jgi:hypothetical protein